ncbi:mucin-3A [Anabrus simplex]|uniref:mucin-3A n=1 Tax=Anabrus simplex TaxID=316456 RepID=UPI0035A29FDE
MPLPLAAYVFEVHSVGNSHEAHSIQLDCHYEGQSYKEGDRVHTEEPCLNCSCVRGSLVCHLRVCPVLPDPPPPGCVLLKRRGHCCSELICDGDAEDTSWDSDIDGGYDGRGKQAYQLTVVWMRCYRLLNLGSEWISPPHPINALLVSSRGNVLATAFGGSVQNARRTLSCWDILFLSGYMKFMNGWCMVNGTLYAEGSAMASSSQCNFCYCIRGQQRCVEPQCLLPLQGCKPQYQPHSCCPIRYDCSEAVAATTTPATAKGSFTGCEVDGEQYSEGDMVQGVANSSCDSCFCMKGKVQCVPLTCSIPLQSCKPIILPGDCCPSSFECGAPDKRLTSKHNTSAQAKKNTTILENTASLSITYDMEPNNSERIDGILVRSKPRLPSMDDDSGLLGNTLPSESRSNREMPAKMNNTILKTPKKNNTSNITTMLNTDNQTDILSTTYMTTTTEITTEISTITTTDPTTIHSTEPTTMITADTTLVNGTDELEQTTTESIVLNKTETEEEISTNAIMLDKVRNETNSSIIQNQTTATSQITYDPNMQNQTLTTERTPIQDTDTQNITSTKVIEADILERTSVTDLPLQIKEEADIITEAAEEPITMQTETTFMTLMPTTVIMPEELDVVNVTLHKNVNIADADNNSAAVNESLLPVRAIPPELEAILNITHNKDEDYEYDYNEPSLPPSLPGVRIIPFVAADAVVEDKNSPTSYPKQDKHRPTDNPVFYKVSHPNLFSPPAETEGGFVPREPILDGLFYESKFDVPYHTTGMNIPAAHISLDITSGTIIPPAITILPKTEDEHCLTSGREYRHGDLLPSSDPCLHCICYYGEVLCQAVKCPAVKSGCRRLKDKEHGKCCGRIVSDKSESPTVVLDRIDVTAHPQTLQQPPPHLGGIVPPITVADGVVTPDPFRDVIRTEPAPDLPSLISDIMPYLLERHTSASTTASTLPAITTADTTPATTSAKATTTSRTTTTTKPPPTTAPASHEDIKNKDTEKNEAEKEDDDSGFSFDSVLQFLFSADPTNPPQPPAPTITRQPPNKSTPSTLAQKTAISNVSSESATVSTEEILALNTTQQLLEIFNISLDTREMSSTPESVASSPGSSSVEPIPADSGATSGLLKLAGCNIYGRMYRVGRIISELSGPCLECMCTEVGVQCRALDC